MNYRNTTQPANPAKVPVVGSYSLGIWPLNDSSAFFLRQSGDIPAEAQSLRFLYHGDNLTVFIGGTEQYLHRLEDQPATDPEVGPLHYFAVDVSPYAGQTTELRFQFRSLGNYPGQDGGPVPGWPDAKFHVLDDLSFSPLPAVPEPQTWALLGTGLGALWWHCRRQR